MPYTVVVGEKEITTGQVTPRLRSDIVVKESARTYTVDEFLGTVAHEAKARVSKSSL